jgi:hypothetical protein
MLQKLKKRDKSVLKIVNSGIKSYFCKLFVGKSQMEKRFGHEFSVFGKQETSNNIIKNIAE